MFSAPFSRPIRPPFGPGTSSVAAAPSWWLPTGITAANCICSYAPKGAADLAASYINLNNPGTGNAAPGVAPTWDATSGWIFNGSSQYLKTPAINQATGFIAIRFSNRTSANWLTGHFLGANDRFYLYPRTGDVVYYIGAVAEAKGAAMTAGNLMLGYSGGYRDGVSVGLTVGSPESSIKIHDIGGAGNNGAAPGLYCAAYVQAYAAYSTQLSQAQVTELYTAMAAL